MKIEVDKLYTPKQVAELLQVDAQTIYNYVRDGKVKAVKLANGTLRIPHAEIRYLFEDVKCSKCGDPECFGEWTHFTGDK